MDGIAPNVDGSTYRVQPTLHAKLLLRLLFNDRSTTTVALQDEHQVPPGTCPDEPFNIPFIIACAKPWWISTADLPQGFSMPTWMGKRCRAHFFSGWLAER